MNEGRPPEPPASGLVAGRYVLSRMIGRGGMGEVWEARHHTLGTLVAIKFIDARHVASPQALARFQRPTPPPPSSRATPSKSSTTA